MFFNRRRFRGQTLGNWVGNNLLVEQAKMLSLRLKNENRKKKKRMAILCLHTNGTSTDIWFTLLGDSAYLGPIILIFFFSLSFGMFISSSSSSFLSLSLFLSFLLKREKKERTKESRKHFKAKME